MKYIENRLIKRMNTFNCMASEGKTRMKRPFNFHNQFIFGLMSTWKIWKILPSTSDWSFVAVAAIFWALTAEAIGAKGDVKGRIITPLLSNEMEGGRGN